MRHTGRGRPLAKAVAVGVFKVNRDSGAVHRQVLIDPAVAVVIGAIARFIGTWIGAR